MGTLAGKAMQTSSKRSKNISIIWVGTTSGLQELRPATAPWQQQAIDRITPLLREVASNTESTIDHLNSNPERIHASPYRDYVVTNYDLTNELAALVGDFVDYGKTRAKFEKLTQNLEVAKP